MYYTQARGQTSEKTYICDLEEGEDDLVEGLHVLGEAVQDHALRVLLEELELGMKDVGYHLIVDALVDLHELQGCGMINESTYDLVTEVFSSKGGHDGGNHNQKDDHLIVFVAAFLLWLLPEPLGQGESKIESNRDRVEVYHEMIEDQEEEGPGPAVRVGKVLLVGGPSDIHKVCLLVRILDDLLTAIFLFTVRVG
jgi:hypothetical protein